MKSTSSYKNIINQKEVVHELREINEKECPQRISKYPMTNFFEPIKSGDSPFTLTQRERASHHEKYMNSFVVGLKLLRVSFMVVN